MEYKLSDFQKKILKILKEKDCDRKELVKLLDKPRSTMYDNLALLVDLGMIRKYQKLEHSRGRPRVFYKLNRWSK